MLTRLRIRNFKSWQDTDDVRLGKLTGLFGTNSSGKTSLLQFLLMLKQTAENQDRSRVLHTGNEQTYVDLGTFYDVIHGHTLPGTLAFELDWMLPEKLEIRNSLLPTGQVVERPNRLRFEAEVIATDTSIQVQRFAYRAGTLTFGMERESEPKARQVEYRLIHDGYEARRTMGRKWKLPQPVKCYGFPNEAVAYYQNVGFLPDLPLAFEDLFRRTYYLGPLRDYARREYTWAGERPTGVGDRGELAVPALLASQDEGRVIQPGKRMRLRQIDEHVAWWLRELGVVHDFELRQIAENRKQYEVRVRVKDGSPWVLITDVGFGVSQLLPVLVLCFYAPEGSTLIFEQPEIHLHPRVQSGLADVFIDAIERRGVQIILESHSEHLLRRLQLRMAEGKVKPDETALSFVEMKKTHSTLTALDVDPYGNIRNWPDGFFGDALGEAAAMMEAEIDRREQERSALEAAGA